MSPMSVSKIVNVDLFCKHEYGPYISVSEYLEIVEMWLCFSVFAHTATRPHIIESVKNNTKTKIDIDIPLSR